MRIAGLTEEPLLATTGLEGRTEAGLPWVRWVNLGSRQGWYAVGARESHPNDFWSRALALGTVVGNGRIDAVHSIGNGVLSVGGLGVTVESGLVAVLLGKCLETEPARWLAHMGPALVHAGVYLTPAGTSDWRFVGASQTLQQVLDSRKLSKLWVQCISQMLRDDRFDVAQARFLAEVAPGVLGPRLVACLAFKGRDIAWFSQEQQAVWAVAIVMALADTALASQIMEQALERRWPDASGPAEEILRSLNEPWEALENRGVPPRFATRLVRTMRALPTYFRVKLPEREEQP